MNSFETDLFTAKKTFVVTGGAGFIGCHLTKYLTDCGHNVKVIDICSNPTLNNLKNLKKIKFYPFDILQKEKLFDILKDTDGIFHEAGLISVKESEKNLKKYYDVNVKGTVNIFELAKKLKLKIVFASSASVYGEVENMPIKENHETKPSSFYGHTKLKCEKLAQKYVKEGTKIIGLRYFNVYGEGQSNKNAGVITNFLNRIKYNKNIYLDGTGYQTRDFIHVHDVVKSNFKAMTSCIDQGIFNIASGKSISIIKLAKMMINFSNSKSEIKYNNNDDFGLVYSVANVDLSNKKLGWKYEIELRSWLENKLKYMIVI